MVKNLNKREKMPVVLEPEMKEPINLSEIYVLVQKMMTLDQLLYHEKQRKQPKIIVKYEEIESLDQSGIQWEEDTLFHYAKTKDKEIKADYKSLHQFAEEVLPLPLPMECDPKYGVAKVIVKTTDSVLRLKAVSQEQVRS